MRYQTQLIWLLLICLGFASIVNADVPAQNPLEWLARLEVEVYGQQKAGGLLERLGGLEDTLIGRTREGTLVERLSRLDTLLFVNQPQDISLIYKIQVLEWVLFKEESAGPLAARLTKVEQLILGRNYSGSITQRLEKLIQQVFPDGVVRGNWTTVPEGTLIKIRLLDALNSKQNRPGDKFNFTVVETVTHHEMVLFPKGIVGQGEIQQIKHAATLGRDALLALNFDDIRALDGTMVKISYGKALETNRIRPLSIVASTIGMLTIGPGGILLGLAVKGRETTIPSGSEFYLQVKEPVGIYTLHQ